MKNKTIFIVLVLFVITAFVLIYLRYRESIQIQRDEEKSTKLSVHLRDFFSNGKKIGSYSYYESNLKWEDDYLLLEHTGDSLMSVRYSVRWNEKANTKSHFPGDDTKGLVVIETLHRVVGTYESSLGAGGSDKAIQRSYVLHFFDTASQSVLGRDTLFGVRPNTQSSALDSSVGDLPSDQEVISRIRRRVVAN